MKNTAATLLILLILIGCKKEVEEMPGNLQITGNIEGLKNGTLYIQKLEDTSLVVLDSIKISGNSSFETHLDIESPEMLYLSLDRGVTNTIDNNLMFFAEPGKMNISTTLEHFYADVKVTGSKNHDLYEEYRKVNNRFTSQQLDLTEEQLKGFQTQKPVSEEDIKTRSEVIMKRKYLYAINFAVNNKNHEVAPYIALSEIHDANVKYLDTINQILSPKVKTSKYGKLLDKYVAERKSTEVIDTTQNK